MPSLAQPGSDWPPNKGANSHVEIDADMIVYSCAFAAEKDPLEYALRSTRQQLREIVQGSGCDTWTCHLTHEDATRNFRTHIATIQPYKGNRAGKERPKYYKAIREYILEHWEGVLHDGFEADDGLAISHYQSICPRTLKNPGRVLASADKDLRGVRGAILYNWQKGQREYLEPTQALRFFYQQCLTGDSVDHIKGLSLTRPEMKLFSARSVGERNPWVTGLGDIESEEGMYAWVLNAYENRWAMIKQHRDELHQLRTEEHPEGDQPLARFLEIGPEEALLENARLLHMLEHEGQLWEPPKRGE